MTVWSPDDLLDAARLALLAEEGRRDAEQAVYGVDSLREIDLHPILAAGFAAHGLGVLREHPYPGLAARRPAKSHRDRCDLVLLPRAGLRLLDPTAALRARELGEGTLFEHAAPPAADLASPAEAYWLEVKAVGQFEFVHGVPSPNHAYAGALNAAITGDLAKIAGQEAIRRAGLLLILFTAAADVATHDLGVALHRAIDRGVRFREPRLAMFPIRDRIGNAACTLALLDAVPEAG